MNRQVSSRAIQNFLDCLLNDHLTVKEIKERYRKRRWKDGDLQEIIDFLLEKNEIVYWAKNHEDAYMIRPRLHFDTLKKQPE